MPVFYYAMSDFAAWGRAAQNVADPATDLTALIDDISAVWTRGRDPVAVIDAAMEASA